MAKKKATRKAAKKASTKKAAAAPARKARSSKLSSEDLKTITLIDRTASMVHKKVSGGTLPELKFPVRSLSNVKYDKKVGYFELGRG